MISGFADQGSEDIYNGTASKAALKTLARALWKLAQRKLTMLNAASAVGDLRAPPGNMLEKLSGDLAGLYSIRINSKFRIVFAFEDGQASEVRIVDYH